MLQLVMLVFVCLHVVMGRNVDVSDVVPQVKIRHRRPTLIDIFHCCTVLQCRTVDIAAISHGVPVFT